MFMPRKIVEQHLDSLQICLFIYLFEELCDFSVQLLTELDKVPHLFAATTHRAS